MRRLISLLFSLLLLVQAIPVLHFFSSQPEVFYVYLDEEKPEEKSKEKKEDKESLLSAFDFSLSPDSKTPFHTSAERAYRSPLLEFLTPPPDAC